jgi:hypothetical protein
MRQERHGDELYQWAVEDGRLYRRHTSLGADAVLDANKRAMADHGARTLSFGRPVLRIPLAQYHLLAKLHPGLKSRDAAEKSKAIERICNDPDFRYLVCGKW